jgi:hypothetical protein
MHVSKLRVDNSIKNKLIDFLLTEISCTYKKEFGDTTIIAGEEFRFRINSNQFYFIILNTWNEYVEIEIVCGGGGDGLFQFTWGSETSFIKRAKRVIAEFCQSEGKLLEEIHN